MSRALLVVAAILLSLNVTGLFRSLRPSSLDRESGPPFNPRLTLDEGALRAELSRHPQEDGEQYLRRLNRAVHDGILHYWQDEGVARLHLHVPLTENYLLHLAGFAVPGVFRKYQFIEPERAIERGVGLCSQQAIVALSYLERNGLDADIAALSGHVVVQASLGPDAVYIADPDFGVVVPHSLREIEERPELIRPYYEAVLAAELGGETDAYIDRLVAIYGPEGNDLAGDVATYVGWKKVTVERLSYLLIWVIPALLCVPFVVRRRRRQA